MMDKAAWVLVLASNWVTSATKMVVEWGYGIFDET
jgi:hypothetical protein